MYTNDQRGECDYLPVKSLKAGSLGFAKPATESGVTEKGDTA